MMRSPDSLATSESPLGILGTELSSPCTCGLNCDAKKPWTSSPGILIMGTVQLPSAVGREASVEWLVLINPEWSCWLHGERFETVIVNGFYTLLAELKYNPPM